MRHQAVVRFLFQARDGAMQNSILILRSPLLRASRRMKAVALCEFLQGFEVTIDQGNLFSFAPSFNAPFRSNGVKDDGKPFRIH